MDRTKLIDFTNQAHEAVGKYRLDKIFLSPDNMRFSGYSVSALTWQSVPFGTADKDKVPDDKRGIYAFVLCEQNAFLPPHGYVLYIGIAGRKSGRSLRTRYGDYLNPTSVLKRERIARMIALWADVLRFYFVPVDDAMTSTELETLEDQLNSALMPPFSEGDLDAETKRKRRAFT